SDPPVAIVLGAPLECQEKIVQNDPKIVKSIFERSVSSWPDARKQPRPKLRYSLKLILVQLGLPRRDQKGRPATPVVEIRSSYPVIDTARVTLDVGSPCGLLRCLGFANS